VARKAVILLLFSFAFPLRAAVTLPVPDKHPSPPTPEHRKLVLEAIQAHDLGDYPAAIRRFEKVLAEDADDVGAIYEFSNTLLVAKDYQRSLQMALKGAGYDSRLLPDFYCLIASDLDELGDQQGAIAVSQEGIKRYPHSAVLPFNLGVTYARTGKPEEARRMYQAALVADPGHVSSHFRLAALYAQNGYTFPAVLASLRFLELASDTQRSHQVLQFVLAQMFSGAQQGARPNEINVTVNLTGNSRTDEGDFTGPAAVLGIGSALGLTADGKKLNHPQLVLHQNQMIFEVFENNEEIRNETKKFAAAFYRGYFRALHEAGHTEAFTYYVLRTAGWPEVSDWLQANADKTKAYQDWSKSYDWSACARGRTRSVVAPPVR
jgi:tetratricopeptide (TPR) repeat protein